LPPFICGLHRGQNKEKPAGLNRPQLAGWLSGVSSVRRGWFAGRLGRDRVCVLVKGKIEMPSDFAGIGYTDMDDRGAWKAELLRELQAAGYANLDWASALA
jgi:Predicted nucleotide-binding protein containing TIR-like domain